MGRKVAITAFGLATPFGVGVDAFWDGLRSGEPALTSAEGARWASLIAGPVGQVPLERREHKLYFDPRALRSSTMTRATLLSTVAAGAAIMDAGLDVEEAVTDAGCYLGSYVLPPDYTRSSKTAAILAKSEGPGWGVDDGRLAEAQRSQSAFEFLKNLPNMPGAHAVIRTQFLGPSNTYLGSDAAGLHAVAMAAQAVESGEVELMFTGGVGAPLHEVFVSWLARRGVIAPPGSDASTPRKVGEGPGLVLGEAACILVLESEEHARKRGAKVRAWVESGTSRTVPEGADPLELRVDGLRSLVDPQEPPDLAAPSYLGDPQQDRLEKQAWEQAFNGTSPSGGVVLSGMLGSVGPASGPLALAASILAMEHGYVPATTGWAGDDPPSFLHGGQERAVHRALISSGGLDSSWAGLVVRGCSS